jgi:hypothetical protein
MSHLPYNVINELNQERYWNLVERVGGIEAAEAVLAAESNEAPRAAVEEFQEQSQEQDPLPPRETANQRNENRNEDPINTSQGGARKSRKTKKSKRKTKKARKTKRRHGRR